MLPILRLGPLTLQAPGLALLAGVWLGVWLAERQAARLKLDPAAVSNLIYVVLFAGLLGARLTYAARNLSAYLASPLGLFALTPATLWPEAGLLIGLAAAAWYGRRRELRLRPSLDALAPGLAAFLVALGVAHLFSGDAYGAPARLPWSLYLWDEYRHPAQVYEILAALLVFGAAWKKPFGDEGTGLNLLAVVALAAAARVLLETFRGDSLIWAAGFRAGQVIGLLVLAAALWLMRIWAQTYVPTSTQVNLHNEPRSLSG